jgi:hypothetical protein
MPFSLALRLPFSLHCLHPTVLDAWENRLILLTRQRAVNGVQGKFGLPFRPTANFQKRYLVNSTTAACGGPTPPADDTGTWYTSDPQQGGANGQVFNLDSIGIADLSAPGPDVSRIRVNFEAHAVGPDGATQISPSTTYFVRVSCVRPGATAQPILDVGQNDNQIGTGSTPTTWNLQ